MERHSPFWPPWNGEGLCSTLFFLFLLQVIAYWRVTCSCFSVSETCYHFADMVFEDLILVIRHINSSKAHQTFMICSSWFLAWLLINWTQDWKLNYKILTLTISMENIEIKASSQRVGNWNIKYWSFTLSIEDIKIKLNSNSCS